MLELLDKRIAEKGIQTFDRIRAGISGSDCSSDCIILKNLKKILSSKHYDYSFLSMCKQDAIEQINIYIN